MRKIVFKTFIIVLGLSIVPLKADAQFFKKLFSKKKEKPKNMVSCAYMLIVEWNWINFMLCKDSARREKCQIYLSISEREYLRT